MSSISFAHLARSFIHALFSHQPSHPPALKASPVFSMFSLLPSSAVTAVCAIRYSGSLPSHPWYCDDAERDEPLMIPELHNHHIRKGTPHQMREIAILRAIFGRYTSLFLCACRCGETCKAVSSFAAAAAGTLIFPSSFVPLTAICDISPGISSDLSSCAASLDECEG